MNMVVADPANLEELRLDVIEQFTSLLNTHIYSDISRNNISSLVSSILTETMNLIRTEDQAKNSVSVTNLHEKLIAYCTRLNNTLLLLQQEQQERCDKHKAYLLHVIPKFNQIAQDLGNTIIEKELILRQAHVLQDIIDAHEDVAKWESFVNKILLNLYAIFPFRFFLVVHKEEEHLFLNIYYGSHNSDKQKEEIQKILAKKIMRELALPIDNFSEIKNIQISEAIMDSCDLQNISMTTLTTLEGKQSFLANILGVSYAPLKKMTLQEESIVRSILTVISMVINSSKTLCKNLKNLKNYATHDPLTGLHNRRYFNEILEYEIARSERYKHEFVILMIDLDDFKDINDSYGHLIGDAVLQLFSKTITAHVRKGDVVARIGGDEFALILMETNVQNGKKTAELLRKTVSETSFQDNNGQPFKITISIGVIHYPGNAKTVTDLMAGVDIALYHAKATGKNAAYVIDSVKDKLQTTRETQANVEQLRMSLNEGRIVPFFQPIINCKTGKIFAYEVLARLYNLNGEVIPATVFGETIEKHGLSRLFNEAIISKALKAQQTAQQEKESPIRLFINLSTQTMHNHNLLNYAENLCAELNISPENIIFEILERDAIIDIIAMKKWLFHLHKKGFSFALDDFGTGYNSFHYLRELSFKYVKLDGSFVKDILNSKIDHALVKNIVCLCQDLGIATIAESVESAAILAELKVLGIDYVQGYHVGIPLPKLSGSELIQRP